MQDHTIITITGIIALTILGVFALQQGIDHGILASISGLIGALAGGTAGYHIGVRHGSGSSNGG